MYASARPNADPVESQVVQSMKRGIPEGVLEKKSGGGKRELEYIASL